MKYKQNYLIFLTVFFLYIFKIFGYELIYDGDTPGFRLSNGIIHNDSHAGYITETAEGFPGNCMRIAYIDVIPWWQEHWWDLNNNKNIGNNTHLVFNVKTAIGEVHQFSTRITWSRDGQYVEKYLIEGGDINTTWKTARIPLPLLLGTGQTILDFVAFANNWNTDYTVLVDNIRFERIQTILSEDLIPVSVSTGQKNVYTTLLIIENLSNESTIIKGVTLTVKDELSNTIQASTALSGIELKDENTQFFKTTISQNISNIYCFITSGIQIGPNSKKNIYVMADITGNTINHASNFMVNLDTPANIRIEDSGGNTIKVETEFGYSFPMGSSATVIQNRATELSISHTDTMPDTVSTGQQNVKAMEFEFTNVGNTMTASIKVSRISLVIQDASGNCIPASSVIKKLKIANKDGSFIYGETDAGSSSKLTVILSAPLIVPTIQNITCAILMDMNDDLISENGRISMQLHSDLYAVDANSLEPVIITSPSPFPKESSAATIQERVSNINLDNFTSLLTQAIVKGQRWVNIFNFRISDTLGPQSAAANFNGITISVKSSSGLPQAANAAIERFYILDNIGNTLGSVNTGVNSKTYLKLTSPYIFTSGLSQYFKVIADILPGAYAPDIKLSLENSGDISITDSNSGYEADKIATPVLPWETGVANIFTAPATDLYVWHNGNVAPTMVGLGQPDVKFMTMHFYNAGNIGTADIKISGITLTVKDGNNNIEAPSSLLESVYVTNIPGDITYAYFNTISITTKTSFYVPFLQEIYIETMNTKNVYVSGDVALYAIQGTYKVGIEREEDIKRQSVPVGYVTVTAVNMDSFPMESNSVTITALAYNFKVGHENLMPVSVVKGSKGVEVIKLNFENYNAVPIGVTSIAIAVKNCGGQEIEADKVIERIKLVDKENNEIRSMQPGSGGKINISGFNYRIGQDAKKEIKLVIDIKEDAREGFYIEVERGEDISTLPLATVNPAEGDYFGNMKSGCVSIQERNLEQTFHLFPNPFNPVKECAKIEYYLENESEVTIQIFTMNGRLVKKIIEKVKKSKGLHYEDTWDGKNEIGYIVRTGVYLCTIEINDKLNDTNKKLMKKIAVLR